MGAEGPVFSDSGLVFLFFSFEQIGELKSSPLKAYSGLARGSLTRSRLCLALWTGFGRVSLCEQLRSLFGQINLSGAGHA